MVRIFYVYVVRVEIRVIVATPLEFVRIECEYVVALHDSHLRLVAPEYVV